jgi:hypothetical protein
MDRCVVKNTRLKLSILLLHCVCFVFFALDGIHELVCLYGHICVILFLNTVDISLSDNGSNT